MTTLARIASPARGLGEFFAMALDVAVLMFRSPWAWREFILQSWFVARVSLFPTFMLSLPYTVLTVFVENILLVEFGAADVSGAGAAQGVVTQIGPVVTVLVISGAGATAMCADLGARTIREELDALRVLGINPVQALVVPRVVAATMIALLLNSFVTLLGITGGFLFSVFFQHVTPGAFAASLTLLTGPRDVVISLVKAALDTAFLQPLNLSRDKIFISSYIDINSRGLQIDSLFGRANFNNITMLNRNDTLRLDSLQLISGTNGQHRILTMQPTGRWPRRGSRSGSSG